MLQLFPLISDIVMSDKYLEPQQGSSKLTPLTSFEMRKVLEEVEDEREDDLEEESEFSRVLAEMPDLEGDYGELTLGFNEELCFGPAAGDEGLNSVSVTTSRINVDEAFKGNLDEAREDNSERGAIKAAQAVPAAQAVQAVQEAHADQAVQGDQPVQAAQAAHAVPIHRGDLIEFMISDRTWFLVEVTGRGKLGGKNQNYLNVKYSDGSEGGVYIDKHEWRIVKRKDLTLEDSPERSTSLPALRLHRVTVDLPAQEEFSTETETTTTDTDDCGLTDLEKQKVGLTRKRKKSRRKRDKERKTSVDESGGDSATSISTIKRGDRIEYIVKEEDGKVKGFSVS